RQSRILQRQQGRRRHRTGRRGRNVFAPITAVGQAGLQILNKGRQVSYEIEPEKQGTQGTRLAVRSVRLPASELRPKRSWLVRLTIVQGVRWARKHLWSAKMRRACGSTGGSSGACRHCPFRI